MALHTGSKTAAVCEDCGKAVAVWVSDDGTASPIGQRRGCSCGNDSFRLLSDRPSQSA
ncbi:hypothetical protein [Halopiger xanaduensis]|uniref:Uncharacterized protein n=1 Tax=Halopiger xanaduensis (strain DSM 18323 / JCM 14033 / SH-6) TaxID=797210 RepID=F8D665_HALXS|nr:hypothetical protein [Halopiger xanaduensis]AEH35472.1 hypothetical protein Halxa_0833 [Halopiger xanaduensis SH-6]